MKSLVGLNKFWSIIKPKMDNKTALDLHRKKEAVSTLTMLVVSHSQVIVMRSRHVKLD